jgi:hypothetical protein
MMEMFEPITFECPIQLRILQPKQSAEMLATTG